jgi:Mg2+ and Co2+ transporter CorA
MVSVRRIPVVVLCLALCPAASSANNLARAASARPALQAALPRLSLELHAQLSALDLTRPPTLLAQDLAATLSAPDVSAERLAAGRLIVASLAQPETLPQVQALLRGVSAPGQASGDEVATQLERLAEHVSRDEAGAAAFRSALGRVSALEALLSSPVSEPEALRAGLDAFFAGEAAREPMDLDGGFVDAQGAASSGRPASWGLQKPADPMDEPFRVIVGRERSGATVSLGELLGALEAEDGSFLDRLLPKRAKDPKDRVIRLGNGKVRVMVTVSAQAKGAKRVVWADFYESDHHPLLGKLAEKFTFAPFRQTGGRGLDYEAPHIDRDNAQLTTYGLRLAPNGDVLADETMHLYVGQGFLVTTHAKERPSVTKAQRLLTDTGAQKSPAELMGFILGDTINRYGMVVDSLSRDFSAISAKASQKVTDDTILDDALKAAAKIDLIYGTVLRQKQVLRDLLSINEFHKSPNVPVAEVEKHLAALDHHLAVLDHYQERKNGLVELYRAKVGNDQNATMKRLAAVSALIAPAVITVGLMGMNVALPLAASPYAFFIVLGFIGAVTGGLYLLFRRMDWL